MAKITRLNPPPNWPRPPAGWTPPPDWQPDPAWGPLPPGWQLWVTERANPYAWTYTWRSALGLYAGFLGLLLIVSGGGFGAEGAGELLAPFLVGGVVTGLIARSSRSRWPVWLYPLVVFGFAVVLRAISTLGRQATGG
jgi:hypothetical protein